MKWRIAALALLCVNLGFGAWAWSTRPESRAGRDYQVNAMNRLILLDELAQEERDRLRQGLAAEAQRERAMRNLQEVAVEAEGLDQGGCYLYSLPNRDQLLALQRRIAAYAPTAYMGELIEQRPGAVMLYIAPLQSYRLAELELNELRAAGVDGFIIPDGAMANGISVGVFNSEQNVQQRTQQLRSLGYNLQSYQYTVDRASYSVNLPVLSRMQISDEVWAEIEADFPQISTSQNSCWKVASTSNFN